MAQPQRPIYLSLAGTSLLCLLIGVFLFARKRLTKSTTSKAVKHSVETSPESSLAYWTEDKMQQAKPASLPVVDEHPRGKRPSRSSHSDQV